jgi:hypothetical protein
MEDFARSGENCGFAFLPSFPRKRESIFLFWQRQDQDGFPLSRE